MSDIIILTNQIYTSTGICNGNALLFSWSNLCYKGSKHWTCICFTQSELKIYTNNSNTDWLELTVCQNNLIVRKIIFLSKSAIVPPVWMFLLPAHVFSDTQKLWETGQCWQQHQQCNTEDQKYHSKISNK